MREVLGGVLLVGLVAGGVGCPPGTMDGDQGMDDMMMEPTEFQATLDGAAEVPAVDSEAAGNAVLTLNAEETALAITIQLTGLDLDGNQTPGNTDDDVTAMHVHNAPAGQNGGVVFGFIGPNSDTDGDLVINAATGTVTSEWDAGEGNETTLTDLLDDLKAGNLYINVHTNAFASGEIRGQVVRSP